MSRLTVKVSPKSQLEDEQDSVRKARKSPEDHHKNHTGHQRESCDLIDYYLFIKDRLKGYRKAEIKAIRRQFEELERSPF